jgi:hypothetical protein
MPNVVSQISEDLLAPQPPRDATGRTIEIPPPWEGIPSLKQLLPRHRGWPGLVYLQVTSHNRQRARAEGWEDLDPPYLYQIAGPTGIADMHLLSRGKLIPGQSPDSGERLCVVDELVEAATGLVVPQLGGGDLKRAEEAEAAEAAKATKKEK